MNSDASESKENTAAILCPSCSSIIGKDEMFCPECEAPVSSLATLDPMQTIRAEGFVVRKATEGKPKPIVLIGIWLLFLPFPIAGMAIAVGIALNGSGTGMSGFFFFWGGIGLSVIGLVVLFKVTRNYFKTDSPADRSDAEHKSIEPS